MSKDLSDTELVRSVRGGESQVSFAKKLGVAQSMLSDWERGAVKPRKDTWMSIGNIASLPLNLDCWERGGMPKEIVDFLRTGLGREAYWESLEYQEMRDYLQRHGIRPEAVTEPLGDEPVGGEAASKTESLDEWEKQYGSLEQPDWGRARVRIREVIDEWLDKYGPATASERMEARRMWLESVERWLPKEPGTEKARTKARPPKEEPIRRRKK